MYIQTLPVCFSGSGDVRQASVVLPLIVHLDAMVFLRPADECLSTWKLVG